MKNFIRAIFRALGYDIHRRRKYVEQGYAGYIGFHEICEFYIRFHHRCKNEKNLQLVQVGANDGRMHDPVYKMITRYNLPSLLIEPQPAVFKRLKENYKNASYIDFENIAISPQSGQLNFFSVRDDLYFKQDDFNFSGLASFDKNHVVKGIKRFSKRYGLKDPPESYIKEIKVQSMPLQELIESKGIEEIDILQIDAEGYDFEVLKTLDYQKNAPSIIHFEHSGLDEQTKIDAWKYLSDKRYYCAVEGTDSVCLHMSSS